MNSRPIELTIRDTNSGLSWSFRSNPATLFAVFRRKCRYLSVVRSNLAADDVDIAVAYPDMGGQVIPVITKRRTIIKH
jgi:hypothetical protein